MTTVTERKRDVTSIMTTDQPDPSDSLHRYTSRWIRAPLSNIQRSIPLLGNTMSEKTFSLEEVGHHCHEGSCWLVVYDHVYDVTEFLIDHPGGREIILEHAGYDATTPFESKGHSVEAYELLRKYCIGELIESERRYQNKIPDRQHLRQDV